MCTDTHDINDFRIIVNPYEEKVVLHMAFPTSGILPNKTMTEVTCRKRNVVEKILQDFKQRPHLTGIIPVTFQVLFCSCTV